MNKRTLVLLPGMEGTGVLFGPLLRSLPEDIEPIIVSYPPAVPLTYQELLPIVEAALPAAGPYVLLGESFSGPLAILAASRRPPNLKGLILCGTFIGNPVPWIPMWFRHFTVAPFFVFTRPFVLAKALLAGYGSPELLSLLRKAHAPLSPSVMAARARAILGVDVRSALKEVGVPIWFIGGSSDRVSPARNLREIMRVRPDVKASMLPGPHLILQTQPARSAAIIDGIIRSTV